MIIGMGSDLCNIERIQASLDRFGERFVQRVFTPTEQAKAARRPYTKAGTLAKRFAAHLFRADGYIRQLHAAPGHVLPVLKTISAMPQYQENALI